MKYTKIIILGALIMAMPMAGCDTDALHDLNKDPQSLNEIDLNFLFTSAELGSASGGGAPGYNRNVDWRTNIGMGSYATQFMASIGGWPGSRYTENTETDAAPFTYFYGGQLKNFQEIIRRTSEGGFAEGRYHNLVQATRILMAWSYHRLTDMYGSVPYSEASRGLEGIFFPKYDDQKSIYEGIFLELKGAAEALDASALDEGFSQSDIIYNGDVDKWRKFAYSIMLRLAMRVSNVDAAMANQWAGEAMGKTFTGNEDNAYVPMAVGPGQNTSQNGIIRAYYPGDGDESNYLSRTMIDWLKGPDPDDVADDDPRLMILSGGMYDWTPNSYTSFNQNPLEQLGLPNGYDRGMLEEEAGGEVILINIYSRLNILLMDLDEPYPFMTYAEVEFLLAEAAERGIGGASGAKEHYDNGVTANMKDYLKYDASFIVDDAAISAYLAQYEYGVYKPALEMIGEQVWVNHLFNWYEGWSNWKRTGFPQLTPHDYPGNETGGTIPRRLKYSIDELAVNFEGVDGGTKPDEYTTRVWWDGGTN